MKPTSDRFKPRKDGWFQHDGKWGEVVVGTVIAGAAKPNQRWEVVDVSQATQVEYGHTLWMRLREQTTGEEHTLPPRLKTGGVIILTQDAADEECGEPTPPSNADAIALLIEALGAQVLASRDERTGEIICPDYAAGESHDHSQRYLSAFAEHLRFAHGLDVADDADVVEVTTLHGQSHNPRHPDIGKGGFPHRHAPEDLSIFTGLNNTEAL